MTSGSTHRDLGVWGRGEGDGASTLSARHRDAAGGVGGRALASHYSPGRRCTRGAGVLKGQLL